MKIEQEEAEDIQNWILILISIVIAAIVAGIAASEKVANDGNTTLGVYREGIFRGFAGTAAVTVGLDLITDASTSDSNELVKADATSVNVVGTALETASSAESFIFELSPRTGGRDS